MKIQRLVFPDKHRCEVEEAELEERLGPGEVLVRIRASLVSAGTELAMFNREHRGFDEPDFAYAKYPFRPGYAAAGEIVSGAGDLKPGTRVLLGSNHATFTKAKAEHVRILPDDLPDEHAPFQRLLSIAMTSPRMAPAKLGEQVVVIGMGLVGNLCAQLYALSGAGTVAGVDLSEARLRKAADCGVPLQFHVAQRPLVEWVKDLGKRGAELVVEATGSPRAINDALKAVADRGIVVLLGSPRGKMELDPYFDIHRKGCAVIGAHGRNVDKLTQLRDDPLLLEWIRTERVKVAPLITHRMPMTEGLRAFEGLRDKPDEYLGVILTY